MCRPGVHATYASSAKRSRTRSRYAAGTASSGEVGEDDLEVLRRRVPTLARRARRSRRAASLALVVASGPTSTPVAAAKSAKRSSGQERRAAAVAIASKVCVVELGNAQTLEDEEVEVDLDEAACLPVEGQAVQDRRDRPPRHAARRRRRQGTARCWSRKCRGRDEAGDDGPRVVRRVTSMKATRARSSDPQRRPHARAVNDDRPATSDSAPGRDLRALASAASWPGTTFVRHRAGSNWSKLSPFHRGRPSVAPSQRRLVVRLVELGNREAAPAPTAEGKRRGPAQLREHIGVRLDGRSGTSSSVQAPSADDQAATPCLSAKLRTELGHAGDLERSVRTRGGLLGEQQGDRVLRMHVERPPASVEQEVDP